MKTSIEFISDLKIKSGIASDYALAKLLGVTKVTISHYQNGKTLIGDATAMRVAELLDLDPAYVVACIHAERAKHEGEKKLWERIAAMASGVTLALMLLSAPLFADTSAAYASEMSNTVYYVKLLFGFFLLFHALRRLVFNRITP